MLVRQRAHDDGDWLHAQVAYQRSASLNASHPAFTRRESVRKLRASVFHYCRNGRIIVIGVVVKQDELFYIALARDTYRLLPGAMPPAFESRVFFGCVLRVVDQNVGVLRILA